MEPRAGAVATTVHGRYLVAAPRGRGPWPVLLGFHGYGENAEAQLDRLRAIPGASRWLLVSVQALHPFYSRRLDQVVASWMTRLDRERAIADNLAYIGRVAAAVKREFATAPPLVYAGFSQGAAMAYRAAALGRPRALGLITLGDELPPELAAAARLRLPPTLVGRGSDDAFYRERAFEADLGRLEKHGIDVTAARYTGGHEWNAEFAAATGRFLRRLRP